MRGVTVKLYQKVQVGTDPFGAPVYDEEPVTVENVLIGEPSVDDIATSTSLYGKSIQCVLGIPKGDRHDWQDKKVEWTDYRGVTHCWRTFGFPAVGVDTLVPGPWHMKVKCEAYG